MSYLNLPSLEMADTDKGIISLWFRYSQDAVDSANAHSAALPPNDPSLSGPDILRNVIPLVTFGRKVTVNKYTYTGHHWVQTIPFDPGYIEAFTSELVPLGEAPGEPSYLGLVIDPVRSDPDTGTSVDEGVFVKIYFQMDTRAEVKGLVSQIVDIHWEQQPASGTYQQYRKIQDISYIRTYIPEFFIIETRAKASVDQWHHLLVSFDFSSSVNVTPMVATSTSREDLYSNTIHSYCKLWYAFDDKDMNGKDNMGDGWVPQDPNGIVPGTAKLASQDDYVVRRPDVDEQGRPITTGELNDPLYNWVSTPVPVNNGPVGFPASADYVETIYHCELAEFQMWTGVILDTSIEKNRRAFVDENGKPVSPDQKKDPNDPTSMSGSIELVKKTPEVLLRGSGNWKIGKNTGTLGLKIEDDGTQTILPEGQFVPKGGINSYKPDPSIQKVTPP